jgi:hypothetical protein
MTMAYDLNPWRDGAYRSLHIHRTGLDSEDFLCFFLLVVGLALAMSMRTFIAAYQHNYVNIIIAIITQLTAGAPSISSIIRQFGLPDNARTDLISVEDSNTLRNVSGLLSSLALISTTLYPH